MVNCTGCESMISARAVVCPCCDKRFSTPESQENTLRELVEALMPGLFFCFVSVGFVLFLVECSFQ